jgi:hypothetical protein
LVLKERRATSAAVAQISLDRSSRHGFPEELLDTLMNVSHADVALAMFEHRHDRVTDGTELTAAVR